MLWRRALSIPNLLMVVFHWNKSKGLPNMNAFGRLGETEDIAGVILFLAGEESQWVTGQTIRVNGGFI